MQRDASRRQAGPLENYKNLIRTALGILPRLNVPKARWRIVFWPGKAGGVAWCCHGSWLAPGRLGEGVFFNREQS